MVGFCFKDNILNGFSYTFFDFRGFPVRRQALCDWQELFALVGILLKKHLIKYHKTEMYPEHLEECREIKLNFAQNLFNYLNL
ncbi:hypothetical protein BKM32_13620 [Mangrovimonas sp. DI 80]|nr:hypothetical protein BKM32_13620 [Mangrovimonas sp. DI 80]